jgi:hypothetical protein
LGNIGKQLKTRDIRIPPRTTERFRILCRILTITNALDIVFNYKGGIHNGKDFSMEQLLDVEPLLYCTEEIAVCALNMVAVEIPQLSVSRTKTLRALWTLFTYSPVYKKDKDLITGMAERVDYNYIRFTGGTKPLLTKIQNAIPYHEGKPSLHNINSVLKQLSSEPFKASEYQSMEDFEVENPDMTPIFEDQYAHPCRNSSKKTAMAFTFGQNYHDVHIGLFDDIRLKDNSKGSIMTECIKNIVHLKTRSRRIITGIPERSKNGVVEFPQFMQVLHLKANKKPVPKIRNSNQESEGVKDMMNLSNSILGQHDVILMDTDTDTWAWSRRCMSFLGMESTDAFEYHPLAIKEQIKVSNRTMSFPNDLKNLTSNQEEERNVIQIKATEEMGLNIDLLTRAYKRRKIGDSMSSIRL